MKYSLDISDFLEEISSLSHSIIFLYFFALIAEEGFLIFPCYSWNSAFRWVLCSFSPLPFTHLFCPVICEASSDNHFALSHFFLLGIVLVTASYPVLQIYINSSSGTVSIRSNFLNLFASMWNECNCTVVWPFFSIALHWDWNENWPFPVLWPLLSFPDLLTY